MKMSAGGAGNTAAPAAQTSGSTPAGGGRSMALLIEDDLDQRVLLTRLLERFGYTVHAAASATEAMAVPASGPDDGHVAGPAGPARVIVLDLRLPDLSGRDLLDQLRDRHPGCPVVVCSVLDVEDYPAADGVLPKPVTSAALRQVLADLRAGGAMP